MDSATNLVVIPLMPHPNNQRQPANDTSNNREIVENLSKIERRDWWIWANAIFVMLLLTGALLSFALPSLYRGVPPQRFAPLFRMRVDEAIISLVALILLFNVYTVYQQVLIKRLRRQLAEKQHHSLLLRELAMIDALTGLYNRRFGEQRLVGEVARSARKGHPLTVVLLDLDEFKHINDSYGHAAGDLVLQEFAASLNRATRSGDIAVRMGGDEFLLILPECNRAQLELVLDRLGSLEATWDGKRFPIRYSVGWKEYAPGDEPETMLAAADQALYEKKRASRASPVRENVRV
ncbi:MAG TPA: GGDEF domain-containing protein [Candidatus Acidoferrum sp.]|nr:GGDEF domain-containing protein [Candidatus Acidoferrum sp.]